MAADEALDGLAAVVLAYGPAHFGALVARLREEGLPAERIVVVQNPRTPGEADHAVPAGTRLVRMADNGGYAPAMNAGMAAAVAAGATRSLLLTHDVGMEPGALAALAAAGAARRTPGITGPRLRWLDEEGRAERVQHGGWWAPDGRIGSFDDGPGAPLEGVADVVACDHVDGAALLVDHVVVDRVGGLDERFFLYFEETDWCLRAGAAGLPVGCAPGATFTQSTGASSRPGAFGYLFFRNHLECARRHGAPGAVRGSVLRDLRELPLKRLVRPGTSRDERARARARAIGHLLGVVAYALRRFGPPPAWLPGMGDVAVGRRRR